MIRKTSMTILVLAAGIACAAPPAPAEAPIDVVSAEFGLFADGAPGELVFEPTDVVPHRVGQRYGWIIEVRTARRSLSVREEYLLAPAKAAEATAPRDERINVPLERRSQVSQRQLVPVDGRIYGEWAVGPGEPAGRRLLEVVVEKQTRVRFEYEVK